MPDTNVPKNLHANLERLAGPRRETCAAKGCRKPARWKYCSDTCYETSYKRRKLAAGECVDCGATKRGERRSQRRCESCAEKHREIQRRYRKRLKEKGLCTRCGREDCPGCNSQMDVF